MTKDSPDRKLLPSVYPITDSGLTGLTHAEQLRRLAEGGALFVQLREKQATPRQFYEEAKAAVAAAREFGVKVIINDRADIALALRADGLHLGQDDLSPVHARRILGEGAIIGFSTHSVRQAVEAARMPVDYIAIGPVFPTGTKENPPRVVGIEGVRRVREAIGNIPLVAIGGITPHNFGDVLGAGADSVAIISGVLLPPETIPANLREFLDLSSALNTVN